MTIALVTPYFPDEHTVDSGIANHYLLLAQNLAAKGNQVIVLHIRERYQTDEDNFSQYSFTENIIILTYKVRVPALISRLFKNKWAVIDFVSKLNCMLVTARVLNKIVYQYGIDVIETTSYFSLCFFLADKKVNVPVAVRVSTTFSQMMNDHYPFKSRAMDQLAKMELAFIKRSKYLLTHAHSHAMELEKLYSIISKHFEIIPHGVNLPAITKDEPPDKTIKILYVGRLEYRKGTDVLLAAIPLILLQNPDVLFELIGDDSNNDYQKSFTANNPAAVLQQVIFRGKVDIDDLAPAYRNCDIFVAPSRYESFGLIFIEAMSYSKPVIGCDVGGITDIITNNHNGLFAETGDAKSLADKISQLIENVDLRAQLGQNARKTVENRFTGEQLATHSIVYYNKLIADF